MATQYGMTSSGNLTRNRELVEAVDGHKTLYSYDGVQWVAYLYSEGVGSDAVAVVPVDEVQKTVPVLLLALMPFLHLAARKGVDPSVLDAVITAVESCTDGAWDRSAVEQLGRLLAHEDELERARS
jgi:hypothetical protein